MKKKVLWLIIMVAAISLIWYKIPIYKHRTFEGVLFQLGAENAHHVQAVEVEIKGVMKRYFDFYTPRIFEGTIRIHDQLLPPPGSPDEKLKVYFSRKPISEGTIQYRLNESEKPFVIDLYGKVEFNFNLSKMAIMIYDERDSFNSGNGMMIAAPAANRAEALKIADKLFRSWNLMQTDSTKLGVEIPLF